MKRGFLTALVLLALTTPATAQLSGADQRLLGQVVASEPSFRIILGRWEALSQMPDRTPAQESALLQYAAALNKDRQTLKKWIGDLKAAGINFTASATLNARQDILEDLKTLEQAAIAEREPYLTDIQAQIDALKADGIPDEEQQAEFDSLNQQKNHEVGIILERESNKAIIETLKAGGWTWAEAQ